MPTFELYFSYLGKNIINTLIINKFTMGNIVGIDLGGTSVDGGLISDGCIIKRVDYETKSAIGGDVTLNVLKNAINELINDQTIGIGIGVPSIVDRSKGIVYNVQNIAGWNEVHLKSILESEFEIPVEIDNDANCFAYGEKIFGSGKTLDNFVGVTLGTGVGAGIIQNNRLLTDANCGSGEFGELPYLQSKIEDYCASRFFINKTGKTGYELAKEALEGDEYAIECFCEYGTHIAYLIKAIVLVLDPQAIIFGGSISNSYNLFEKSVNNSLKDFPYPKSIEKLKIIVSTQSESGILGAASLCVNNHL